MSMNPSYNGSSSGLLAGGTGPVISSGAGSSDAGDLILSSDKGRSKKWILVLVAVFVVSFVAIGLVLMFVGRSNNDSNSDGVEESSAVRVELQKMFKIDNEISKYDGAELARIYVEENFIKTQEEISVKLNELDQKSIEYVAQYVMEMKSFVEAIGRAIEVYHINGCQGDTVEVVSKCELSPEAEKEYLSKLDEAMTLYESVRYTVASAKRYYENGGGSE